MKKITLLLTVFISLNSFSQSKLYLRGDTVFIQRDGGNAELVLLNSTRTQKGFLYNNGNGRTTFKQAAIKLNDSTYVIGGDTLRIKSTAGPAGNYFSRSGDSASYVNLPNQTVATPFPSSGVNMFDSSGRWSYRTSTLKTVSFSTSKITASTAVIDSLPNKSGTFAFTNDLDLLFNDATVHDSTLVFHTVSGDTSHKITFGGTTAVKSVSGTGNISSTGGLNPVLSFTGNLPVTNLNSGTGASSSTYWRGDGTWSTISGTTQWVTTNTNDVYLPTPGNVTIGSNTTPASTLQLRKDNIGVNVLTYANIDSTYGLALTNDNLATVGQSQDAPMIRFRGNGWKTTATAASNTVEWRIRPTEVNGAAIPSSSINFDVSTAGSAYTTPALISNTGQLTLLAGVVAPGTSTLGATSVTSFSNTGFYTGGRTITNNSGSTFSITDAPNNTSGGPYTVQTFNLIHSAVWSGNSGTFNTKTSLIITDWGDALFDTAYNSQYGVGVGVQTKSILNKFEVGGTRMPSQPYPVLTQVQRDSLTGGYTGSITNAGSAYTNGSYQRLLTGGVGSGAYADIIVAGNVVTSVTIRNYGVGYLAANTLSASLPVGSGFVWTVSAVSFPPLGSGIICSNCTAANGHTGVLQISDGVQWNNAY